MQGTQGSNSQEHRARESYSSTCSPPPTQVLVIHPDYIHVLHGKIKFFVYFFPPREVDKRGEAFVNLKTSSHLAIGSFRFLAVQEEFGRPRFQAAFSWTQLTMSGAPLY